MSRSVFALRFRETVGITPMEYLTRWRMLLVADRLKNTSDGLSAIAQSLGYESQSALGKAFRRITGCSPRQYTRAVPAIPMKQAIATSFVATTNRGCRKITCGEPVPRATWELSYKTYREDG